MSEKSYSICGVRDETLNARHVEQYDKFKKTGEAGRDADIGAKDLTAWYEEVSGRKLPNIDDRVKCIYLNGMFQVDNSLAEVRETLENNGCLKTQNGTKSHCATKLLGLMDLFSHGMHMVGYPLRSGGQLEHGLLPAINGIMSRAAHLFTDVANTNFPALYGIGVLFEAESAGNAIVDHAVNPALMTSLPPGAHVVSVDGEDVTNKDHCTISTENMIRGAKDSKVKLGLYYPLSDPAFGGACFYLEAKRTVPLEAQYRAAFDEALGMLAECQYVDADETTLQNLDLRDPLIVRMLELGKKHCAEWRSQPLGEAAVR